jgi:2,4-dienoyl-CoA reductase-like NADH-dependent reductase (Old Yellow Enzyme family)
LSSDFIGGFQSESSKTQPISLVVERLARGEFDMIALGGALLQDPDWAQKIKQGRHDELAGWDSSSLATLY